MHLWKIRRYQICVILWLTGIVISVTFAQWLHELGHIVVALVAGAPVVMANHMMVAVIFPWLTMKAKRTEAPLRTARPGRFWLCLF